MRKLALFIFCFSLLSVSLCPQQTYAQGGKRGKPFKKPQKRPAPKDAFTSSQWWLGFKIGTNITSAQRLERHDLLVSIVDQQDLYKKDYEGFRRPGIQAGAILNWNFHTLFSLSFQPTYNSMNFGYKTTQFWEGSLTDLPLSDTVRTGPITNGVILNYKHRFTLNYVELPLLVRFDFPSTRFHPYIQAGGFYGLLTQANKFSELETLSIANEIGNTITNQAPVIGAKNLFITSNWGWIIGGGLSMDLGNVRIGADLFYKQGANNITNVRNRYTDTRQIGTGDVLDDIKLRNIEISFNCMFPLKFLQYQTYRKVRPK